MLFGRKLSDIGCGCASLSTMFSMTAFELDTIIRWKEVAIFVPLVWVEVVMILVCLPV